MKVNFCHYGNTMELVKDVPSNSIDLIITSPPYANTISYGDNIAIFHPDNYPEWFMPLATEAARFLKPTGSFILNINDNIMNGKRSIYVFELICRIERETGLSLHDRYIWSKKNPLPTGSERRLNDSVEFIFHFCRKQKNKKGEYKRINEKIKTFTNRIRTPYAPTTLSRYKYTPMTLNDNVTKDGVVVKREGKKLVANPDGVVPGTVFSFKTVAAMRNKAANKHPAPFHSDLPRWFINWLTDEGDLVLDPFMGSGTTAKVCKEMKRNWLGFELNEAYKELMEEV